ncbi:MAG: aldehyde ferredoxin oxidoreductase family protein [Candidatus Ranarchaeia archaeon]
MWSKGGYAERILNVDLSKGKVSTTKLDKETAVMWLGGTGFITKIMWEETNEKTDPLSPEAPFIVATGPMNGTLFPGAGRTNVGARSPLTGVWGEANFGGHFGATLKQAGYDMIKIVGSSSKPTWLMINDDEIVLKDASDLWGKNVHETHDILYENLGDEDMHDMIIGPASENLVKYGNILSDCYRAAGRAGMGTVWGAKKLKAITVQGSKGVKVADPDAFMKRYLDLRAAFDADPHVLEGATVGTMLLMEAMNEIGRLPTKNHQLGQYPDIDKVSSYAFIKYQTNRRACQACPNRCHGMMTIPDGPYAFRGEHAEYESLNAFSSRIWSNNTEAVLYAGHLCEEYGMDTIEVGAVVAMMMELWEKGIITEEDTDGVPFKWGDHDLMIDMIKKVAYREGKLGKLLAEGSRGAAKIIGRGAEEYSMDVKGMAISGQDGRAQKSMAIAHATSVRGADHLRHCSFFDELGYEEAIEKRFGKQYLPEMADRLATKYKGKLCKETEMLAVMIDALNSCTGTGIFYPAVLDWADIGGLCREITGMPEWGAKTLRDVAMRVVQTRRAFNIRLGLTRKEDILPKRMLNEPAPTGPNKGHTVPLDAMLDDYYGEWGWDIKTGLVPRKNFEELGLKYVADELGKRNLLPTAKGKN